MSMRTFWAACAVAAATAVGLPARAAGWTLLESEHFALYVSEDDDARRDYLKQLEGFRWLALKVLGANEQSLRAQARFKIYLMPGLGALRTLYPALPENTAGVYHHCTEGSVAHSAYSVRWRQSQDFNQIVLMHEYAHHLMFQYATSSYPAWYVEGFADYMAPTEYAGGELSLGAVHQVRYDDLRRPGWLPFEDVLRWRGARAKDSVRDTSAMYSQSWLLAHYMLSDNERAIKLAAYFARLAAGEDPVTAFEPATGIAVADLRKLLTIYSRDSIPMLKVRSQDLPKPVIKATPLPAGTDDYLPEASALESCVPTELGQAILAKLRTLAPKPAQAPAGLRLALARAESRYGDAQAAIAILQAHLEADADSAEAHYLLGRAWGLRAEALDGEEQRAARGHERSHLLKAYRLRKDDAPTLYFLARALQRNGIDNNVLNAARAARVLAPSVPAYAVFEAQLDLLAGDRERAARALGPLASNPHDPQQAARMRQAIEAIRAGKSADEVSAWLR